jgi:tRNA dimethylallyltransferase
VERNRASTSEINELSNSLGFETGRQSLSSGFFFLMRPFFIVGPTATGKSELAAEVARHCNAEIVSADAFQIYRGLDLLTAKPDQETRAKAPHHLLGAIPPSVEMNAEKFRTLARETIQKINRNGKSAIVVGGSGLYIKTLTHGLAALPGGSELLREQLNQFTPEELYVRLKKLDPETARTIDRKNARRLIRAIEICLLTGKQVSAVRATAVTMTATTRGVFVLRERDELYDRINRRVDAMFANGVVDEMRALKNVGPTAAQALGLREIQRLLTGEISEKECISQIQQATRHYAKRQLTWFRRQTNFSMLNLSRYGHSEAIEWILREARLSFAHRDD